MFVLIILLVIGNQSLVTLAQNFSTQSAPKIQIKFFNGTIHLVSQASQNLLIFKDDLSPIEFTCIADYPITWEYIYNDEPMDLGDQVEYQRLVRNPLLFQTPSENQFLVKITFWKLFESQTGKYVCRAYHAPIPKSHVNLFIYGLRMFNTVQHRNTYLNETVNSSIGIYCPVTNPYFPVTLYKKVNVTEEGLWVEVATENDPNIKSDPIFGFKFINTTGHPDSYLGIYECRIESGKNAILEKVTVVLHTGEPSSGHINGLFPCRHNQNLVDYLQSAALEKLCENSHAYYRNRMGSEAWRKGSSLNFTDSSMENEFLCDDAWSLEEYAMNINQSKEICFYEKDAPPTLEATGEVFSIENGKREVTKLTVKFNGLWKQAGGNFILAICRNELKCSKRAGSTDLEYLHAAPSHIRYYPMASQQVIWRNVEVNGTDIAKIVVFQPLSDSPKWHPFQVKPTMRNKGTKIHISLNVFLIVIYAVFYTYF